MSQNKEVALTPIAARKAKYEKYEKLVEEWLESICDSGQGVMAVVKIALLVVVFSISMGVLKSLEEKIKKLEKLAYEQDQTDNLDDINDNLDG